MLRLIKYPFLSIAMTIFAIWCDKFIIKFLIYRGFVDTFPWNKHCTKNKVFHYGFLQYMWPYPLFPTDLVTFTEEIRNGKLHFLCSEAKKLPNVFKESHFSCYSMLWVFCGKDGIRMDPASLVKYLNLWMI